MGAEGIVLPQDKGWTRIGPGGGGSMFNPAVSPHDPETAILTCDMTGQYLTRNGGGMWRMCHLMIWCDCFAFDPVDPKRIYAGANALYASDDFAQSWRMIWPGAHVKRETHLVGDEASPVYVGEGWPGGRVSAVAVDPRDNNRLLASVGPRQRGGGAAESAIYLSPDRGRTWSKVAELNEGRVHHLAVSPDSGVAWAVASGGLRRSADRGESWESAPFPGEGEIVAGAVGFPRGGPALLYVVTSPKGDEPAGLFVSADGGRAWRHVGAGVQQSVASPRRRWGAPVTAIGICRDQPQIAYLGVSLALQEQTGPDSREIGVVKTSDGGATWEWVLRADPRREPDNLDPDWLTAAYGSMWPDCPFGLGVAPTNPEICYASDMGRTIMTGNGGRTWEKVINGLDAEGGAYTRGLDVTTCYGVHFDPHHPDTAFISYTDIGLHKSRNGGKTWHHRIRGVPHAWRNTCYWMAFDPEVAGRVWSVWSGGHDYPRLKMFRTGDASRYRGGVCVSDDGGETWAASMTGMPEVGCTRIVLDPTSPAGKRVLYVTGYGRGVYKSTDDGDSWKLHNQGLPEDNLNAWWLAGDPAGAMYLLITRSFREGWSVPGGIFRTTDGAATWQRLPISEEIPSPNDLCVHPGDPRVTYAAAWPVRLPDRVVMGGVFKTADGGASWERLPFPGEYVYGVTIDPRQPEVVYATAWHRGVFRSEDGGRTWSRLGGANFGWPHRVFPDPADPEMIYLTTFGATVWHGPKQGTPGAGPDIVDLPPVTEVRP